ncbi:MAG: alpha-L-rhamnosidase N-terminal domain-containing protein, partial [Bacteroidota bacterium]
MQPIKYFHQRSIFFYFLFLSLSAQMYAQEVGGIWLDSKAKTKKDFHPKASWIWMQDTGDVMLARKSWTISEELEQAILYISASSQYQLYLNGKYIARGPARSAPHHQSVDAWEVKSQLRKGQNLLAIRVHKQDKKYSYHHELRGGLWVQLEYTYENGKTLNLSDSTWKVHPDSSWDNEAPKINRFQQIVVD